MAAALTTGDSEWLLNILNFEKVEGNFHRQIIMFVCCLLYFARFTFDLFVFVQRKISWVEGGYTLQDYLNIPCILTSLEMPLPISNWH